MKDNTLTPDGFGMLLDWLNKDREQAGQDYENIRRRLIRMFIGRGCYEAEILADRTFDRVTSKLDQLQDYVGPREPYFYTVGSFVLKEWLRPRPSPPPPPPANSNGPEREQGHACLDDCLQALPS